MKPTMKKPSRLLLHACCGPCSLEPVRLLREQGIEPHIYYANSNIAPSEEYEKRLETIRNWADEESLEITAGPYDPHSWEAAVGSIGEAEPGSERHAARCRACYRLRFEEAAKWALAQGFDGLGTTLSVSPYQYTDIIREELERACNRVGIRCYFEDYSPHYREATRRSKEAGMYRQNYCGCRFSDAEATIQRTAREEEKAARVVRRAEEQKLEKAAQLTRQRKKAERAAKQARKHAVLKALREQAREQRASHEVSFHQGEQGVTYRTMAKSSYETSAEKGAQDER